MDVGSSGKLTIIVPASRRRLEHLISLGVAPGCTVKLVQKQPAYVISVGETTLAIDRDIAREIYVHPLRGSL
jgi:DtxR family Mn-dependent transcriptional regulator